MMYREKRVDLDREAEIIDDSVGQRKLGRKTDTNGV